ncbi:dual specificity protein phosphatase family protein [Aquimarina sp. U1-2]|uniref:phosphatase domain-containing putative toxin n=1 Tax=Aquimarina sp. U1-2 TaxID=2823141 RepID=UPI001AECE43F|nr:dual specificity protein phosphatase family protein [Aquimarina sp. U1-2]MBP2832382.1 dual specificity protein phosphatase family protein [Aquimarina sp. U1-2]
MKKENMGRTILLVKGFGIFLLNTIYCNAQAEEYQNIDSKYFKNLYQINDSLYRSEQPSKKGFRELEAKGIKTVLNVRRLRDDTKKARGTSLQLQRLPLKAGTLTKEDLFKALDIIKNSKKPLLVHCWHGSDRTGAIIAAYRIVFDGWSKEKAIREFRIKDFGYHEKWYPNLIELLNNLDVNHMRDKLGI